MACKVFGVYDKVAETFITVGLSSTAGCFAREIGKMMIRMNPNFEEETAIVDLATIDEETAITHAVENGFKVFDWDIYKRPELPAQEMENSDLAFAPVKE